MDYIPRNELKIGHLYVLGESRIGSVGLWDGKEFIVYTDGAYGKDPHLESEDHWDDNDTTGTAQPTRDLGNINDLAGEDETDS